MEDTIEASLIRDFLSRGPKIPLTDKPLFKLVWSNDERELRIGTYNTFDIHGNFIKQETKPENSLKYSWIKERWILEQWAPPEVCLNPELPDSINGSFEPIYVFEDKFGRALPLNGRVVEIIINRIMQPSTSEMFKRSLYKNQKEQKEAEQDKLVESILSDEGPLVSQFHDGTAIIMPGQNPFQKKGKVTLQ